MRLPWGRFRQLRRRAEDLQLLVEAGRELSNTLSMDEIYTIIHRFVAHCVPCDNLIVSAYDPLTQLITCSYLHSEEGVVDVSAFPPIPLEPEGQGTQSLVIRSGQPLLLPDYEARRRSARNAYFFDEQGNILVESQVAEDESIPRSALLVPLLQDGQVVGVLQVLSNTLNAHNADHLRFLEALAFRATSALSNARLFQRLQAELEERRRAEDEILQLNANLEQRVAERTADLSRLNAELEQAVRTKNEFLATMSHELRTPL
ncbi:MAG: GAF domain-containing protein, partial [Chloroflexota bacterium]